LDGCLQIANAPCSWGVHFADRPENPPWPQVMDEAAAAGFSALDLGPVGYLPTDLTKLKEELAKRGLRLASGVLFDPRRTCAILHARANPRFLRSVRLVAAA
jgi:inosose dehydratase